MHISTARMLSSNEACNASISDFCENGKAYEAINAIMQARNAFRYTRKNEGELQRVQ